MFSVFSILLGSPFRVQVLGEGGEPMIQESKVQPVQEVPIAQKGSKCDLGLKIPGKLLNGPEPCREVQSSKKRNGFLAHILMLMN